MIRTLALKLSPGWYKADHGPPSQPPARLYGMSQDKPPGGTNEPVADAASRVRPRDDHHPQAPGAGSRRPPGLAAPYQVDDPRPPGEPCGRAAGLGRDDLDPGLSGPRPSGRRRVSAEDPRL